MNSNRTLLYVIGAVIAIAIVGVIAYAVSQNKAAPMADMNHHDTSDSTQAREDKGNDTDTAAQTDKVSIENYAYSPAAITVKVGTKVTWTNHDSVQHTVTIDEDAPDKISSGLFGKDESFSFTFDKAGTYHYFCEPHPYMKGTVTVTE